MPFPPLQKILQGAHLHLGILPKIERASEVMVKLWTDFAKFGHPTPSSSNLLEWMPVSQDSNDVNYMDLSANPTMRSSVSPERMLLWDKLIWGPRIQRMENRIVFREASEFLAEKLEELKVIK